MIIMALDHTRYYFHVVNNPTDLEITTPMLFFTRFITHYCAPVFVLLAGTSAYLYGSKKTKPELFKFLFSRGLWLIFLEIFLNDFLWFFDKDFVHIQLQIIWIIGFSMICLSFLIYLPQKVILIIGILLIAGHNLLDSVTMEGNSLKSIIWYILHQESTFALSENRSVGISYPLLPWPGIMMLGYCLGVFYKKEFIASTRKKWLLWIGLGMTILFFILRGINIYGDPFPWSQQKNLTYTILSFLNVTKYPASLAYLLITLGPSLIFLSATENIKNKLTDFILVFGRVPLFFYFLHIFVLHATATFIGGNLKGWLFHGEGFNSLPLGVNGYSLGIVYIIWICLILVLYPLCKQYMKYKINNRDKWWLSYL
jgi:uncharacterized membrane protein